MSIVDIRARIAYRQTYTCRNCGAQAVGDTGYVERRCSSVDELIDALRVLSRGKPVTAMPVGWCSYGSSGITCGCGRL